MNNTRILFGITIALLLVVIGGLYFDDPNRAAPQPAQEQAAAEEVKKEQEAQADKVAQESAEMKEQLAAMQAEMEARALEHEQQMKALLEAKELTEGELKNERIERERFERMVNARKMAIRTAPQLTTITEALIDQGFVVIGAGQDKNVSVGQKFRVRRGDSVVGRIEVTSVDAEHAVAEAVPGSMPEREEGDAPWFVAGDEVIGLE
ncbi:hypothetical protein [Sulfuriroseicoccus oceanibius]|uniref:Uncharacterized protein n=1 Tax=Sulfuriroseicoccus oceanibius TaxID=2707525 RepID=A0A6B3LEJ8_9BACT|nr:hypothetical protein [Sulfuriroseicoccus oceanibius]QQL44775.1 hypothetical protein G3M56_012980 [Sulfuriroseicoccus oceanibius]